MRLVLVEKIVPEGSARRVEHHRHACGRFLLHELVQHVEYAQHGARRLALGTGQRRQRMECAIQIGRSIDQQQLAGTHDEKINSRAQCSGAAGDCAGGAGFGDVGLGDGGLGDVGLGEVGAGDVGLVDGGLGDVGAGDVGAGDVGAGDVGLCGAGRFGTPIFFRGCCASGSTSGPFCPQARRAPDRPMSTSSLVFRMFDSIACSAAPGVAPVARNFWLRRPVPHSTNWR